MYKKLRVREVNKIKALKVESKIILALLIVFLLIILINFASFTYNYYLHKEMTQNISFDWKCKFGDSTYEQFLNLCEEYKVMDSEYIRLNVKESGLYDSKLSCGYSPDAVNNIQYIEENLKQKGE